MMAAILCTLMISGVTAASSQITLATYSSPAFGTDVGLAIDLTSCSVQFIEDEEPVPGKDITFTIDGKTVTSYTPASKGVTEVTAVSGSLSAKLYIVAKAPSETGYILYENDFSTDPTAELRIIQQTNGAKLEYDAASGAIKLNGSSSGDAYLRVLLPSWLDIFGDCIIDTGMYLTNYNGSNSRWGSVMFRIQNNDYPYMLNTFRYDVAGSSGIEIGQRTESDAWNIMTKGSGVASNSQTNDIKTIVTGSKVETKINGTSYLTCNSAVYKRGSFGLQVRGVTMVCDYIRISLNPDSSTNIPVIPGSYSKVSLPDSNISLSPVVAAVVTSVSELKAAAGAGYTAAVVELKYDGSNVSVELTGEDGKAKSFTIPEIVELCGKKIIPAFKAPEVNAAKACAVALKKQDLRDAYIISDNNTALDTAKSQWSFINGILLASGDDINLIKKQAIACGARIVVLPDELMTRENINFLQDKYLVVWADGIDSEAAAVSAINKGVCGLISTVPSVAAACMTKYYDANTLSRYSNITGHRGIPSKAQENSLEGCILAAEYGATAVENDIYLVKDCVIMVMHDSTIDRTTTGTGKITSMTSKELAQYKINTYSGSAPVAIPSLEDYLKQFKDSGTTIVIEIKESTTDVVSYLASLLKKYDMVDQVVIISFNDAPLKALRSYIPGISEAYLTSKISVAEDNYQTSLADVMAVCQPMRTVYSPSYAGGALGNKLTGALFARGVTTWIWTVNTYTDFDRYFVSGTRGITTNFSDWVSNYIKSLDAEFDPATGEVKVTATTYKGEQKDVTGSVEMVLLDGADGNVVFADGKISGDFKNASFFFKYDSKTKSNLHYSKVTELIEIKEEQPEETTSPAEETTAAASETEPAKKGCGSFSGAALATLVIIASAAVIKRREDN